MRLVVEPAGEMAEIDGLQSRHDLGIARRRLLVGILHRLAQGAYRDVWLLREEKHPRAGRHMHMTLAEGPDAGERPEQCALARAADARDQRRLPFGQLDPCILKDRAAGRQRERQVLGAHGGSTRLRHDVETSLRPGVGRLLQPLEAVHHGAKLGERGVVVDEER